MALDIREAPDGVVFKILVQPRAAKNQVAGLYGEAVKVRLTAPPVEGKANKACTAFLAKSLGVAKSAVEIVSGRTARAKTVKIACTDAERAEIRRRVLGLIE